MVIQRISEAALGWSRVFTAAIYAETHGPTGYAKLPVSRVKNIHIGNERGAVYGSQSAGPVGAEVPIIYYHQSDPNRPTGFRVPAY